MTFSNIIRKARLNSDLSQGQLAEDVNNKFHTSISKSMISRWEHGTDIQMSYVRVLAEYFHISPSEVFGIDVDASLSDDLVEIDQKLNSTNRTNLRLFATQLLKNENKIISLRQSRERQVQVLGTVSAGTGQYFLDSEPEWENLKGTILPHDYAVRVSGDSMAPHFVDQQIILVKSTKDVHSGQIVIANYDQQAYVKQYIADNHGQRLVSLNPSYADLPINYQHEVSILGYVVEP
ncbi:helix-turn-helix domain-containing protein [Convivina praedatoris]|uniref:LexA repressor n=1 Tax=Convivina praedatoris TaxID=2880963 RepID=A0ABN8HBT0_9LACO|nr:XRE family transcriptional regulator [Convivina sp. LMG 32447]CAH1851481.1 LexA repressor [Convivina sp. LMG 32447]CAH1851500.1 LexA repressor [Convivina sp. LMG 32447]CAH1853225.1 LexA repressor [Convivina sp. LMG 32447]